MTIYYAGAPGAFAHEACLAFAPADMAVAVASFSAVADSVIRDRAASGMLPLRNTRAGRVEEVAAVLAHYPLRIVSEHELPVRMHLLARRGASLAGVRTVISHPMALSQCAGTLAALGLETVEACNTAIAARDLADPAVAVLASEAAARIYDLLVLQRDLQDDPSNATRFARVAAA